MFSHQLLLLKKNFYGHTDRHASFLKEIAGLVQKSKKYKDQKRVALFNYLVVFDF